MIPNATRRGAWAGRPPPLNRVFAKAFLVHARLLVITVPLAGCALWGPSRPAGDLDAAGFAVQGKLGVRRGNEGFSSNFVWHQHADGGYEIELWGPLGQGRTRLTGTATEVRIEAADGETYVEPDTRTAMQRWLGIAVPAGALKHWIRGRPAPGFSVAGRTTSEVGHLTRFEQLGWSLRFSYGPDADDCDCPPRPADTGSESDACGRCPPERIVATRDDARVTIIAREWAFSAPAAAAAARR